ncbi:hypothetical protein P3T76_002622 [Phytophthora citrophthora]|uniref:Uncharacterized protein n=1 Tax=Phytophthora citrophthora TaxID=4793 RepID=A0AAD9GVY8_9STRA|nr:hypothetical protein P3T76_002622 [Phytophthora citrophthora]
MKYVAAVQATLSHNLWGYTILTLQFSFVLKPHNKRHASLSSSGDCHSVLPLCKQHDCCCHFQSRQGLQDGGEQPSQRLLRSNKYPIEEEEDLSEDLVDVDKRGFATNDEEDLEERTSLSAAQVEKLDDIAQRWGTTYEKVALGHSKISEDKVHALLKLRDAFIKSKARAIEKGKCTGDACKQCLEAFLMRFCPVLNKQHVNSLPLDDLSNYLLSTVVYLPINS